MAPLKIDPPLLNSACPWATTFEDIKELYECPHTGAVTTRTSLLEGFTHDDTVHQHCFFTPGSAARGRGDTSAWNGRSSLNTLGYSPVTLSEYLGIINEIVGQRHLGTDLAEGTHKKLFILSVTGTADEVAMAYALIANAAEMDEDLRLAMEVNLSCPNIAGSPPPAYEREGLREYLEAINDSKMTYRGRMDEESVPRVGVKLPPYTHSGQFSMVVEEIAKVNGGGGGGGVDFVTSTNTLGGCLVLDDSGGRALNSETGAGIGGMAGQALHPLSLGNVSTLRKMLDAKKETRDVVVIGVGGVEDKDGFERMRGVGAGAVGCATALGREGVNVFAKISGVKPQEGKVPRVVVEKPRREITDTYR